MKNYFLQLFSDGAESEAAVNTESGENTAAKDMPEAAEQTEEQEFEELIKGKYSNAFAKRTQGIINKRFGKFKDYEKTALAAKPLLDNLRKSHPEIPPENEEELFSAVNSVNENENETSQAQKAVAAARFLAKEKAEQAVRGEIISSWEKQGKELSEIYPDFSLEKEMEAGGDFSALLKAGVSVRKAYEAANLENIIGAAMKYAATNAAKQTAESIKLGQDRAQENSVLNRAATVTKKDVGSLTEKDILKIISEVEKGAKITF